MSQLADWQIQELCEQGMITPFEKEGITEIKDVLGIPKGVISFGLSSYGYDVRLAPVFELFTPYPGILMDVKNPDPRLFTCIAADELILPAHSYVLCKAMEAFDIPRDILSLCVGKSSYARCGLIVNVTPLEPGWRGEVTLEISNPTPIPCRIYAYEGICQFIFFRSDVSCRRSYAQKSKGGASKYQDQRGITRAR